MFKLEMLLKN